MWCARKAPTWESRGGRFWFQFYSAKHSYLLILEGPLSAEGGAFLLDASKEQNQDLTYQAYLGSTTDFDLPVAFSEVQGGTRKEKDPSPALREFAI